MNSQHEDHDPVAQVMRWGQAEPELTGHRNGHRQDGFDLTAFLGRAKTKLGLEISGPHAKPEGQEFRFEGGCPFQPGYAGGNAAVLQRPSGALAFSCFCADHTAQSWQGLRELVDGPRETRARDRHEGEPTIRRVEDIPSIGSFPDEPVAFFVENWIPKGAITTLTGDAGCGKSTLALGIAVHSAHGGWGFGGRKVLAGVAIYLDRENPIEIHKERKRRYGVEDVDALRIWGHWCAETPPDPASPIVLEFVQRHPNCLVVVDGLRAFLQGDENSAEAVAEFYQRLRLLTRLGATVLVIHHTGKAETAQKYRGSSAIKDQTDQLYVVENLSPDPTVLTNVVLAAEKTRYQTDWRIELVWDGDGHTWIKDRGTAARRRNPEVIFEEILREHPGVPAAQFEALVVARKASRDRARLWLNLNVAEGRILVTKGPHNSKNYTWTGGIGVIE